MVPFPALHDVANDLLSNILSRAPQAVSSVIACVNAACSNIQGYDHEIQAFGRCFGTSDAHEEVAAFLAKRPPVFSGT